jgi:Fe2+ or Zn2+ uptake regulation protein
LDAGTLDEQVALVLGEADSARTSPAERDQKATAMSLVWEILGGGPIKRADLLEQVSARGHDYSSTTVDQALYALEKTGQVGKVAGEYGSWERRTTLSAVK